MLFLSIDFGTSSVKMSILDENRTTKAWAKESYSYIILPGNKSEMKEQDLMNALYRAAAKFDPELLKKVDWLCYDTFSPSPVFLDKEGNLVYQNLITHLDRRSTAQSQFIKNTMGCDHYMNISGIYPYPGGCSAMTFIWFLQNMPEIYKDTYKIGHLASYIHHRFTGEWMVDLVNASMMGLYDTIHQSGWSQELIETFGFEKRIFPEIYNPGTQLGTLLPEMAQKLGLRAGIPVAVGTTDMAAANVGALNTRAGEIRNAAGSSEMVSVLVDSPVPNPEYYLRNTAIPGIWQVYATTAGGFAVEWFYEQFCKDMSKDQFYGEFMATAIDTYLDDTSVSFAPYLSGDRQSIEFKTASWQGLTLGTTRGQMLVAVLKAMNGVLKKAIDQASELVTLSGVMKISGGLQNEAYDRLKAHIIPGLEFQIVDDCPILGNAELVKRYL